MLPITLALVALLPIGPLRGTDSIEFRGPPGSGKPNLAVGRDGRVILTWLEPTTENRHALRVAVRTGRTWSLPVTVRESDRFFVNWADFPSLVETEDGQWVIHFLEKTVAKPYAYWVMLTVSADQGRSWSAPFPAHTDGTDTEHGFVSMLPRPGGGADLIWLDGRKMAGKEPGEMTVRANSLDRRGRLGTEIQLDGRSCECCQARLVRTRAGLLAAYRDRSATEVRDIALVRQVNGKWLAPQVVAPDGWEHRACPVNGPALTAQGDNVSLTWYTAVHDQPRLYLAQSGDGGATFRPRVRIDDGQTLGRVDATALEAGAVVVVWLESAGEADAQWRIRRVEADGRVGPSRLVATVSRARLAGFPRMVRSGTDLLVAVTATGDQAGVRVHRLETPSPARR
jgi:hypothetical protein